jgi:hypothetical protein
MHTMPPAPQVREALSEAEAKAWAAEAARHKGQAGMQRYWVVFFHDGPVGGTVEADAAGFCDWGFGMIKNVGFLLANGAQLVYTADDAFNPSLDPMYPGIIFPLPGARPRHALKVCAVRR